MPRIEQQARRATISRRRWLLVGDWSPLVRDPADLLRIAFLVGAVVELATGDWEQALRLWLTFLVALGARLANVPRPFDLAFNLGMSLQAWGNVAGAFDSQGYDKLVHFVLPLAVASLGYILLIRLDVLPDLQEESHLHRRVGIVLLTFLIGLGVGAIYEIYEWLANHVLGAHLHVSYGDTISDLADDAAGALAGGALILVWDSYGWGTRRRVALPRSP